MNNNSPPAIGSAWIIDEFDRPDALRIVVVINDQWECRYLSIKEDQRWPVMQIRSNSTPLAEFGMSLELDVTGIRISKKSASRAIYRGSAGIRRWQGETEMFLPFVAPEPDYWRFDPDVVEILRQHPELNLLPS